MTEVIGISSNGDAVQFAAEAEANAGIHSTPPTITTSAQVDTLMATVPRSY
jgi:hypothetical protein